MAKSKLEKPLVFLKGKKVILRPLNKETDLSTTVRWMNDPEIRRFILNNWPITNEMESAWFDDKMKSSSDIILAITTKNGKLIGTMGVHRINYIDGTATTGAIIGEKEYWGKGYGHDAKMTLLNYLFNTLNLRKVCSSALAFNERSIAYNQKCGYQKEGRLKKQIFRDGKYVDEVLLSVFKKDWVTFWKAYCQS